MPQRRPRHNPVSYTRLVRASRTSAGKSGRVGIGAARAEAAAHHEPRVREPDCHDARLSSRLGRCADALACNESISLDAVNRAIRNSADGSGVVGKFQDDM